MTSESTPPRRAASQGKRLRVDQLLVERGFCESRAQARQLVMAGRVRLGPDTVVTKPGQALALDAPVVVHEPFPFVSRGALKLLAALDAHAPPLTGVVALDVGASTGGFTDVLLQRGARRVYAVDVGYGQLHYRLRQDARVVSLERVNARYLGREHVPEPVDVLTADVSFISLRKVLPACAAFLKPDGWAFVLIKPQFEAQRGEVGRQGVVRDAAVRERVVREICDFAACELAWRCLGVVPSPITGPMGNQESIGVFRPESVSGRGVQAADSQPDSCRSA